MVNRRPRKAITLLFVGLGWLWLLAPARGQSSGISPEGWRQIEALMAVKATWTPTQRKISSHLLVEAQRRRDPSLALALPSLRRSSLVDGEGRVLVEIRAEVSPGLVLEIAARGGIVRDLVPRAHSLRALVPLEEIEELAFSEEVRSIRPTHPGRGHKLTTSGGDVAHKANVARPSFGVDGSGVAVGVLADGVPVLTSLISSGDLPPGVTVLPGQAGSGAEGAAMLEVIFDLAPGAPLLFATAKPDEQQFAANILALHTAGARVLVDDYHYPTEPVFESGPVADAVRQVVAAGAIYISAAGNFGKLTAGTAGVVEMDFTATPAPDPPGSELFAHNFKDAQSPQNYDTIKKDPEGLITLHWNDPWGASVNDYDLLLMNNLRTQILAVGADFQDGDGDPFEFIDSNDPFDDLNNTLVILAFNGPAVRYFHLNTLGGELAIATRGQIAGHAGSKDALAAAAVRLTGAPQPFTGSETVRKESSDGPRRIYYDESDNEITPGDLSSTGGELIAKPDVAAAANVSTSTPGFETFMGTSAAAAHVAAIAALMQENGNLTVEGMRQVFAATALDLAPAGFDNDAGWGIVMADRALSVVHPTTGSLLDVMLDLSGVPNSGPQTFRSRTIKWGTGRFNEVTGFAESHVFTDGFESGDTSSWSNVVP